MNTLDIPQVCIIGAGCSGLAAAKVLHERGIAYDCFEMGSGVGGTWRFGNDNGLSAAYESLHINTSKERMAFSDFPMPAHYPDYPHHSEVLQYFEAYVDHFGFRDTITFRTEVTRVAPAPHDSYEVTTRHRDTGETTTRRYAAVLVANGHHWDPNWPDFPGSFKGREMHSHSYTTAEMLRGLRVLVVGAGNSGLDIVCDAARNAEYAALSTRRSVHVFPKYMFGRPTDHWITPFSSRLPLWLQRLGMQLFLRLARGDQEAYGFPEPSHPLGAEHPAISHDVLNLVGHGKIDVFPNIAERAGSSVRFTDGSEEVFDLIIYATGYKISFPFFDDDFLKVRRNDVGFFRHVVPVQHPNLYFLGLIQPLGAVMPISERQAKWIADLLDGSAGLPPVSTMKEEIRATRERMRKRYTDSKRHTIQVDYYPYMDVLKRERETGRGHPPLQALPALDSAPVLAR